MINNNHVEYHEGRQYPWCGFHNGSFQYFATKMEANFFAVTGSVLNVA